MILSVAIFVLTIGAIVVLPRRVPEWLCALGGAAAVLLLRLDPVGAAWHAIAAQWDVLLFFAGLSLATAAAEEAGIFAWVTYRAAGWGNGSSRRLLRAVVAVAGVTTILLTNDAAALVIAPLVAVMVQTLGLPPLPFVLSVAFIANAASAVLPISNPTNFIIARAAGMNLQNYLHTVEIPALLALCAALGTLWLLFSRPKAETYRIADIEAPEPPPRAVSTILLGMAAAMIGASALSFPVGATALGFAVLLIAAVALSKRASLRRALARSHASIVVLVGSLFVIVDGLRNTGALALPVRWFANSGAPVSALATGLFSNAFNNLPLSMIVIQLLHHDLKHPHAAAGIAAGSIVGLAIGPNLTTIGSLSTMLMLIILRERGIVVSAKQFLLPGIAVWSATIAVAALALLFV